MLQVYRIEIICLKMFICQHFKAISILINSEYINLLTYFILISILLDVNCKQ